MAHLSAVTRFALLAGMVALLLASPVAALPTASPAEDPTPPNIILILADDLDLDLDTVDTMPYLQSLVAAQGVTCLLYTSPSPRD